MKLFSIKTLAFALLMFTATGAVQAAPGPDKAEKTYVFERMERLIRSVGMTDLADAGGIVKLEFRLSESGRVELLNVESENEGLADRIEHALNGRQIYYPNQHFPNLAGTYTLKATFQDSRPANRGQGIEAGL